MGLGLGIGLNDVAMRGGAAFPSLNLDSNIGNLEDQPFVNLSRSSEQTYFDSNGILQTAPANSLPPSYEYNPYFDRWERKGWYIGEERQNYALYSNDLTTWSNWNGNSVTITPNNEIGLDGELSLTKLEITDTTNETHGIFETYGGINPSTDNTLLEAHVSDGNQRYIALRLYCTQNDWGIVVFDLENGTSTQQTDSGTTSIESYGIDEVKQGIYRIYISITDTDNTAINAQSVMFVDTPTPTFDSINGTYSYSGTAGKNINCGYISYTKSTFPSPYIPTNGSTVTRSASLADITDLSWYNQDEGTFVVEFSALSASDNNYILSSGFLDRLLYQNDTEILAFYDQDNNKIIVNNVDLTVLNKVAFAITPTEYIASFEGGSIVTFPHNGSLLNIDDLIFYENSSGYLKSLKYYPKRLSNSQLQSLTNPSLEASLILEA